MFRLLKRLARYKFVPVGWTLVTIVLLCLPGSTLPHQDLFNIPQLDKVVHLLLFGGIVLFWVLHVDEDSETIASRKQVMLFILFSTFLGILLEFVQLYFIPNRSFDIGDIFADGTGSLVVGLMLQGSTKSRKQ